MSGGWSITGGGYTATLLEAGGGLQSLEHGATALVAGPDPGPLAGAPVTGGRGQLLVPWPNRIRDGHYVFEGAEHQLPISEPAFHNASHGLVRWCAWQRLVHETDHLRLGCTLVPQKGYPWELDLTVDYRVNGDGLTVVIGATNRSVRRAPFAAGLHPYLDAGAVADDVVLQLPAATHQRTDDRHLPTGTEPVAGDRDFRRPRPIGELRLDDAWTDLDRDERGWARVRLVGEHAVSLHLGPEFGWVQVFTGDTLGEGARASIAVEPMSAPADAFNSGTDLAVLDPGGSWQGSFRIAAG